MWICFGNDHTARGLVPVFFSRRQIHQQDTGAGPVPKSPSATQQKIDVELFDPLHPRRFPIHLAHDSAGLRMDINGSLLQLLTRRPAWSPTSETTLIASSLSLSSMFDQPKEEPNDDPKRVGRSKLRKKSSTTRFISRCNANTLTMPARRHRDRVRGQGA